MRRDPVESVLLVWPSEERPVLVAEVTPNGTFTASLRGAVPSVAEAAALRAVAAWEISATPPAGWIFSDWSEVEPDDVPALVVH